MKINAVYLKNKIEFTNIYNLIINTYLKSGIGFIEMPPQLNLFNYYFLKSHRSSVTEGNSTSIGDFTNLVKAYANNNTDYIVPGQPYEETYEISNLKKVYEILYRDNKYNVNLLQRTHTILGTGIYKNNLIEKRGKLKPANNYVSFIFQNQLYHKYFLDYKLVKKQCNFLFEWWNELPNDSNAAVFAKYIILQLELIAIHPFIDGNGRIARAFSESYFEKYNLIPYTPYSTSHKQVYQDAMAQYSIMALESVTEAYEFFANFVINSYQDNVKDLLLALDMTNKASNINNLNNTL